MNKKVLTVALAFIGITVGAGFASGQEVLQYFSGFGVWGIVGAVITGAVFSFAGLVVVQLGSYFLASDHNVVFGGVAHPFLARLFDIIITFTLFSLGFVMIAGGGSNLEQQFGLPTWVGAAIITVLVMLVGMLDVDKVTKIIGMMTPVLILCVLIVVIWSFTHIDAAWEDIHESAQLVDTALPAWHISTLNYVGVCLSTVVSMAIVMGGDITDLKVAGRGGMIGGVVYGVLLTLVAGALLTQMTTVYDQDMPMLALVNHIHPWFGFAMAIVTFLMIFNTAIAMFYALAKRFSHGGDMRFRVILLALTVAGFGLSFLGFKELVNKLFPILGYCGIVLTVVLFYSWIKTRQDIIDESERRGRILKLIRRRLRLDRGFSRKHARQLRHEVEGSDVENVELVDAMGAVAAEELEEEGIDHDDWEPIADRQENQAATEAGEQVSADKH